VILAQYLHRLIGRRFAVAVEFGQSSFPRCHDMVLLQSNVLASPGIPQPSGYHSRVRRLSAKSQRANAVAVCSPLRFHRQPVDTAWKRSLAVFRRFGAIDEDPMIGRMVLVTSLSLMPGVLISASAEAQDVPGIEICTVEKTMERRTSCLQSNVDFLQKTIAKLALDHRQRLDAAKAQIEGLKSTVASLQKIVDELQSAQKEQKATPPAKDAAPAVKDSAK
jgi:hypothetical protein